MDLCAIELISSSGGFYGFGTVTSEESYPLVGDISHWSPASHGSMTAAQGLG